MNLRAYAKESLSVGATAVGFTDTTINDSVELGTGDAPEQAIVLIEVAPIRYWMDGSDPTASVGLIGDVGDILTISGKNDIEMFRAIRTSGVNATLTTQFYTT